MLANALPADELERLVREVRRGLAQRLLQARPLAGTLQMRVKAASALLNEQRGSVTHVESNGHLMIRGAGCPLSALTGKHPAVCRAMETLISEVICAPIRECCDRSLHFHRHGHLELEDLMKPFVDACLTPIRT